MKKNIFFGLLVLFLCISSNVFTQNKNNVIFWTSAGFNSLMTDAAELTSIGNVGANLGLGYELNYRSFKFQLGAEIQYLRNGLGLDDFRTDLNLVDTQGDDYVGHFNFTGNTDQYTFINAAFPMYLGLNFGNLYVLGGAKFGLNLYGNSKVSTTVTSTGTYPEFIDDFTNMPDHFFSEVTNSASYPVALNMNVALSGELGMKLGSSSRSNTWSRISVFCDYGIMNVHNNLVTGDWLQNSPQGQLYQPVLNSFMLSEPLKDKNVNTFFAGIKFTVGFGIKEQIPCRCEY